MIRDAVECFGRLGELGDISERHLSEVHEVGSLGVFVPLTGEDAGAHYVLASYTKPSDAGKEVYKRECGRGLLFEGRLHFGEWIRDFSFAGFRDELFLEELRMVGFVGQGCQIAQGALIPGECGC